MKKIRKKLSSKSGETILETLVALLIIVMSVTFLTTAITKSDDILKDVKKATESEFVYGEGEGESVMLSAGNSNIMNDIPVSLFKTEQFPGAGNYFYYYEPGVQKG